MGTNACPWCKRARPEKGACGTCGHPGPTAEGETEVRPPPRPRRVPGDHRVADLERLEPAGHSPWGRVLCGALSPDGSPVRVLVLAPGMVALAEARRRFQRGAAAWAEGEQAGPGRLRGFAVPDRLVYAEPAGPSLAQLLRERRRAGLGPWSQTSILDLLEPLVADLARQRRPHGAIQLHAIALTAEGPVLTDWGVAAATTPEARCRALRARGCAALARAAPEAVSGLEEGASSPDGSAAADVYGLAAVAWELATGDPPWALRSADRAETVPPHLAFVQAGLRTDPRLRPPGVQVWFEALRAAWARSGPVPQAPGRRDEAFANGSGPLEAPARQGPPSAPVRVAPDGPTVRRPGLSRLPPKPPPGFEEASDTQPLPAGARDRPRWADPGHRRWVARGATAAISTAVAFFFVTGLLAWVAPP